MSAPWPSPAPPPSAATAQWRRLHPLSPLARLGGAGLGAAVILLPQALSAGSPARSGRSSVLTAVIPLGFLVLVLVTGVVSWVVTRWRINDEDLQVETGLIRRQSLRIPLGRIQAVDVMAPLLARMLGLAEVRVVSAGRGAERGRLAYLSAAEAPALRAQLLALAHGLAPATPEPPAITLARVDTGRLVTALCMRAQVILPIAIAVTGVALSLGGTRAMAGLGTSVILVAVGMVTNTLRLVNDDFNFSISEAGDGLRLDRGLLQQRHETIPYTRIQAVRLVEPLLWRPFHWCRLEVDVARQHAPRQSDHEGNRISHTLLPVGSRAQAEWLLSRILPHARLTPPAGSRPPTRARLRAPLSYHLLATWHDAGHVCARTGRLQAVTVVIPLHKMQSVRLSSGPLQRLLRIATVRIDSAGRRWHAAARCRDDAEAFGLLDQLPEASRRARRAVSAAASPS